MSQIKKLAFNKKFTDAGDGTQIGIWELSPIKVFFLLIATAIGLTIVYAYFFTEDPADFIGNLLFYSIIIIVVIAFLWITSTSALKAKGRIQGFIISFILILVFYWGLSVLFGHFGVLDFHMEGMALWILLTVLASLGAKRIDGELTKDDVGYGLLVCIVLIGANVPVANGHGFLWNVDNLINQIIHSISWFKK